MRTSRLVSAAANRIVPTVLTKARSMPGSTSACERIGCNDVLRDRELLRDFPARGEPDAAIMDDAQPRSYSHNRRAIRWTFAESSSPRADVCSHLPAQP